ncbi:MAG: hypothetical protein ABI091_23360 [Ferruginibacter sp.]
MSNIEAKYDIMRRSIDSEFQQYQSAALREILDTLENLETRISILEDKEVIYGPPKDLFVD